MLLILIGVFDSDCENEGRIRRGSRSVRKSRGRLRIKEVMESRWRGGRDADASSIDRALDDEIERRALEIFDDTGCDWSEALARAVGELAPGDLAQAGVDAARALQRRGRRDAGRVTVT